MFVAPPRGISGGEMLTQVPTFSAGLPLLQSGGGAPTAPALPPLAVTEPPVPPLDDVPPPLDDVPPDVFVEPPELLVPPLVAPPVIAAPPVVAAPPLVAVPPVVPVPPVAAPPFVPAAPLAPEKSVPALCAHAAHRPITVKAVFAHDKGVRRFASKHIMSPSVRDRFRPSCTLRGHYPYTFRIRRS